MLFRSGFAFTGREWDAESGLGYHRARYYRPDLGRFTNGDPLGLADGTNLYAYVSSRPLSLNDPFGLCGEEQPDPRVRLAMKAAEIIARELKGTVNSRFPTEMLQRTLAEIQKAAKAGEKAAQTAWKLLNDKRFKK